MEGGGSEFANFTLPTLKTFFGGLWSECVWQQAVTCCSCYRMPQNDMFFHELAIFWSAKKQCKDTLHPLSLVIFATATVVAFILLRNSRFNFHCYTQQHLLRNLPRSDAATTRNFLRERLQRAFTRANQLHWTAQQLYCMEASTQQVFSSDLGCIYSTGV